MHSIRPVLAEFIKSEHLPDSYLQTVEQWYLPLAEEVLRHISTHQGPFMLGINGCQGSGKSTLAALLVILLRELLGIRSINLSLDDFYLSFEERQTLSTAIHPLLATRGVPGTHDIELAMRTLDALKKPGDVAIPRFDKASDDRAPTEQWRVITAPVDVVILEGWCLGIAAQSEAELQQPINDLERQEDKNRTWRSFVNQKLATDYQELFRQLDMLVMLKAPGFDNVLAWRLQQEEKLAAGNAGRKNNKIMNSTELRRFISHYERLTRHAIDSLPATADIVFQLNADQTVQARIRG